MAFNFEHHTSSLVSRRRFYRRVANYALLGILFIVISLLIGAIGYRYYENVSWVDAFYNASMILTGMGPAIALHSDASKIFVTIYSIYSGVAFLTAVGVIFAPLFHRGLHRVLAPIEKNEQ
jgi:putative effector of murein hydrolase